MISNDALSQFKGDVLARYPEENCGLIIADQYHTCTNVHEHPTKAFRIAGQERMSLELKHGPVQAVLHSHPYDILKSSDFYKEKYNPAWPSLPDQEGFLSDTVDWGIVSTDGNGISEMIWMTDKPKSMERRRFNWFTDDCFSVARDWYHLNTNIRLPNIVREWEFWKHGKNTVEDGLATIPYAKKLPTEKAQIGDMAVFAIFGSIVNHVGVIVGTNEILHMFSNQGYYAHTTSWQSWKQMCRYVVRFE